VVEKLELQMSTGVGKPAYQYRTVAGGEDIHSSAYKPVLDSLVKTISANLSQDDRLSLFESAGRSLAKASNLQPGSDVVEAIQKSVDAVNSLGATAEMTTKGMVAAFFSEASGKKVSVECKRGATVVCGFKFGAHLKLN